MGGRTIGQAISVFVLHIVLDSVDVVVDRVVRCAGTTVCACVVVLARFGYLDVFFQLLAFSP